MGRTAVTISQTCVARSAGQSVFRLHRSFAARPRFEVRVIAGLRAQRVSDCQSARTYIFAVLAAAVSSYLKSIYAAYHPDIALNRHSRPC